MDRLIALVALRWRIDLRMVLRSRGRALGLLLMVPGLLIFSAVTSMIAFFGVRSVDHGSPETLLPLLSLAATAIGLFWSLSPLLAGVAFTETHDMSRLLHFPIPLPTLVVSSLLANLLQPMVLAEGPVVIALSWALAHQPVQFPFCLAGILLSFGFMLAASQVSGLALHGLSRNRRLQDVALFLGLGFGFLLSLGPILLLAGGGRRLAGLARLLVSGDPFAFSPFAWGARAAALAGRGDGAGFLVFAVLQVAAILGAMALSTVLIHRIHRGALDLGSTRARGGSGRARMVLAGPMGALLEKDVRVAWRDPALKATLLMGAVGPLFLLFFLSQTRGPGRSSSTVLMLASFVGLSAFGANAFGFERRGVSLLFGFPLPRWRILVAKNASAILFRLPGFLALLAASAVMAPLSYLPAVATITLVTILMAAGADNYLSVLFPITVPPPGANPYAAASGGRGLGAAALSAACLLGVMLASSPFVLLAWLPVLLGRLALWVVALPLALAGAAAAYAMLVAGAERLLRKRETELLETILGDA